jgi:hypothetical protein
MRELPVSAGFSFQAELERQEAGQRKSAEDLGGRDKISRMIPWMLLFKSFPSPIC